MKSIYRYLNKKRGVILVETFLLRRFFFERTSKTSVQYTVSLVNSNDIFQQLFQ
ncbi:hypothetical protein PUN28_014212 [Cardiocondyla obscurior]|uniref:Ribosomal protein L20 n=1 Tax=Cardiocondyla obscurior TaxID=286306 RepID=A0AAW2F3Y6_9HYME